MLPYNLHCSDHVIFYGFILFFWLKVLIFSGICLDLPDFSLDFLCKVFGGHSVDWSMIYDVLIIVSMKLLQLKFLELGDLVLCFLFVFILWIEIFLLLLSQIGLFVKTIPLITDFGAKILERLLFCNRFNALK